MNEQRMFSDTSKDNLMLSQNSEASLDILSWILKILKYWYLFVIAGFLAFGLAYLKNKSWTPTYKTATNVLIQDARNSLSSNFSGYQGLGMGSRDRYTNQMIMLKSHDFVGQVVDHLDVNYDIYKKHRFINENLYGKAPIQIASTYISGRAYGMEFKFKGIDENSFSISYEGESLNFLSKILKKGSSSLEPFEIIANYDEPFQHSNFFLTVSKTDFFITPSFTVYLTFATKAALVGRYRGRLSTRLLEESSSVVEISVQGKVPQRDADFLNLLNEEFARQNLEYKNSSAENSIEYLDKQLGVIRDSIDSSESKLSDFQSSTGMYSQNISATKSQLVIRLEDEQAGLNLTKQYMSLLEDELSKPEGLLTDPSATSISSPQLSALVARYNTLMGETKPLGPRNPLRNSNLLRIEEIKGQIRNMIQTMNDSYALKKRDLDSRMAKAQGELSYLPRQERALLTHTRDFNMNNQYYNLLLSRRLESQLQKASNSADNIIIDTPRTLSITNGLEKRNVYTLFLIIGLMLPLIFVVCKEMLFKTAIQNREELERLSKLPVLGTIERSKRKELMVVKKFPRSSFAEGFRNLRSRMDFIVKKETPVSMLVTSTEPGDGKTFIAVNMASIYQLIEKRVVIIDFDLRRPMLSKSLNMDNKPGLSNFLISRAKLDDIIYTHPELNVDIIPAGPIPPNPSELICSDKTKTMLNDLRQKYDYVILDCSPVGLVSDTLFLGRLVDTVLYVVRNEKTNRNFFKYTIRELLEDNMNNITLIYNDVDIQSGYYGSSRYYGKSSYYLKHGSYYNNEDEAK